MLDFETMTRFRVLFKRYWLPIVSGILMGTSYLPFPPWAIAFCFAPLWFQILRKSESTAQAFLAGWWTQFLLSLIGFYWIAYVSHEFGYLPWPVSILALLLFAATVHTYYAFAAAISFWLRKKLKLSDVQTLVVGVCLLSLSEAWWPSLFPWNLGYPWLSVPGGLAQMADSIGFHGLSLLFHSINALVAWLWIQKDRKLSLKMLSAVASLFLFLHFWGLSKKSQWSQTDRNLSVLQIQANIGNFEKYYAERGAGFQESIAQRYFDLTKSALQKYPKTELIVWPESAYPDHLNGWRREGRYSQMFFKFLGEIQTPILTGAFSQDPPKTQNQKDYNGLFLFDENGRQMAPAYHKTFLLAYGEYTPGYDYFPWLAKISPAGDGFGRGPGPTVVDFKSHHLGLQICYESLYPSFTQELSQKGADLLINLTNDSWFGPTSESFQHLEMTLARAIESRRPLIRSTNTGISTVILANGEILEKSPRFQTWAGSYNVRYLADAPQTFYVRYGIYLPNLILILLLSLIGFAIVQRKRE